MAASPPIPNQEALNLTYTPGSNEDAEPALDLQSCLSACFKAHRRTTHLFLKHDHNKRRLKYGRALLRMFSKKPKMTLKSILRTATETENCQPIPTNLIIIKDDATGRLLMDPAEVIVQI
jgi:hypothetical protein